MDFFVFMHQNFVLNFGIFVDFVHMCIDSGRAFLAACSSLNLLAIESLLKNKKVGLNMMVDIRNERTGTVEKLTGLSLYLKAANSSMAKRGDEIVRVLKLILSDARVDINKGKPLPIECALQCRFVNKRN